MNLHLTSSSRNAKAVDSDTPQKHANPLGKKVIHADIQVTSIEDVTQAVEESSPANNLLEPSSISPKDDADKQRADHMRIWWDEAIAKNMNLPEGYSKVSVLIIKWADELDELKTKAEAQELEEVFRDRFHYHTETVELNMKGKPQLQLKGRISTFAAEHNGPNNLLIIYYTGHGVYWEDKRFLQLTACINPINGKGFYQDAHANWNEAEEILKSDDIDADVLTILDTCYASNATKSAKHATRKFELLAACPIDQTTAAPGPNSFTRAMIDNLKELAQSYGEKPFSTFHLNQRICMDERRLDTPSHLWFRLPNDQHILLAPSKPTAEHAQHKPNFVRAPKGYLTLQFALRDDTLNQQQIEYLTRNLSKAFENKRLIGLRRVDWLGIRPTKISSYFERTTLAIYAVTQWKKFLHKRREERLSQQTHESIDVDMERHSAAPSPTRKRSRDVMDDLPGTKRRTTDTSQPPLSPVSNSSRTHDDI